MLLYMYLNVYNYMYIYMSCLICCCACALICFTVGEWETFFSIPLYVLTCKVIDNKATLTFDFDFLKSKKMQFETMDTTRPKRHFFTFQKVKVKSQSSFIDLYL